MAFDIYGNTLRRGHCEVHPHVHEEYPCSVCDRENRERHEQQQIQQQHVQTMLAERDKMVTLLEKYSQWLEQQGYLDTDWRAEAPTAIDQFLMTEV